LHVVSWRSVVDTNTEFGEQGGWGYHWGGQDIGSSPLTRGNNDPSQSQTNTLADGRPSPGIFIRSKRRK